MGNLRTQLSLLWGAPLLKKLLAAPLKEMLETGVSGEEGAGPSQPSTPVQTNNPASFIRRAIEARTNRYVVVDAKIILIMLLMRISVCYAFTSQGDSCRRKI